MALRFAFVTLSRRACLHAWLAFGEMASCYTLDNFLCYGSNVDMTIDAEKRLNATFDHVWFDV